MATKNDLLKVPHNKPDFWYMDDRCQNIIDFLNNMFDMRIKYIIWIGYDAKNVNIVVLNEKYVNYIFFNKRDTIYSLGEGGEGDAYEDNFKKCYVVYDFINIINTKCDSSFKSNFETLMELNYSKSTICEEFASLNIINDISNVICSYIGFEVSIYDFGCNEKGHPNNIK